VAILVGIILGGAMGIINAWFKVPSFMASLAILIAGRAYINLLLADKLVFATPQILSLNEYHYKIPILIFLILVVGYVLKYTPFGYYVRAIGENETAVEYMGVNTKKIKLIAFMISAVMASIAGLFSIARTGGASITMGAGMEMSVMMALFIGGIPVSGGLESKIYKLLIGGPMIVLLENGLVLCGTSGAVTQGVRGIVLLSVVYATLYLNKKANASTSNAN
jgi:ribose/xylose/arabinose/galactoside ABC-type transport system permease subunit